MPSDAGEMLATGLLFYLIQRSILFSPSFVAHAVVLMLMLMLMLLLLLLKLLGALVVVAVLLLPAFVFPFK